VSVGMAAPSRSLTPADPGQQRGRLFDESRPARTRAARSAGLRDGSFHSTALPPLKPTRTQVFVFPRGTNYYRTRLNNSLESAQDCAARWRGSLVDEELSRNPGRLAHDLGQHAVGPLPASGAGGMACVPMAVSTTTPDAPAS